ncbi:IclR family transcriptional regulator [Nocardioides sp. R1-1]|uniref:IclR family transcriptional regulator n=1 Tax=Nocardioides sp. R1-1 TaxID=3383502 RepID=UPI0038D0DB76
MSEADEVVLDASMSKTLHAGLRVLEVLSAHGGGMTITEIADAVGVHRTVAHRLLRTLEAHRLLRRDRAKRFHLGTGLVPLAEPVERDLRAAALPLLEDLADRVSATAHLVVQEDAGHVRALVVVEPRNASAHVAFRPGQLDAIDRGSAGMAILAGQPARPGEREEVRVARSRGYAVSYSEIVPSVHGVSAPVPASRVGASMSVGVSVFEVGEVADLGAAVVDAAVQLARVVG